MHCLVEFTPIAYGVSHLVSLAYMSGSVSALTLSTQGGGTVSEGQFIASIQDDLGGQTITRGHVVSQNKGSWMEQMFHCVK